ncbi:MAG: D-alanyl-D-alanine carboxypeptidase [Terrimesophilobacter sp.]
MNDDVPLTRREAREAERAKKPPGEPATEVFPASGVSAATVAIDSTVNASAEGSTVSKRGGFAAAISKHPKAWMFASMGVIFLLLATASVFTGVAVGSAASAPVAPVATPTPEPTREVPTELTAATALRTCSIASLAADPRLLTFAGSVINVTTGDVLYDRSATTGASPASVLKVITAAAALATVGPSYQFSTKVFEGSEPGSIVLVGGGDPTLSRLPIGSESVYKGAPKLVDLAAQTKAAWEVNHPGDPITKVILDASLWSTADKWDPTWDRSEQRDGWHAEVTALMVDGDRDNPQAIQSRRSDDPIARAGSAFRDAIDLPNSTEVVIWNATPGLPKLGEVNSQPMSTLIAQMLDWSDNAIGEQIARIVSLNLDGRGTASSLSSLIPGIITNYGLDVTGMVIRDGSGLSANNLVPPLLMAQLMAKVATGEQGLDVIKVGLPVAGKTGSLRARFTGGSEIARGQVFAKTGWILTARTLSGFLNASDGSVLSFAFYALGPVKSNATIALDAVTTGAFTCGNNLSNN